MNDEVVFAKIGSAGVEQVIGTCVDGDMGQAAILGEYDHIARYQIGVGGGSIGVLGDTGAGLASQRIQSSLPDGHSRQVVHIVITVICTCLLDLVVDHAGIHTLDVRKVVAQVIGYKGGTHQTVLLEIGDIGSSAGCGTGLRHGLIAIGALAAGPVSDIGQDGGCVGLQAGGDVIGDIQVTLILQPLDIVSGVLQGPEDRIVVHFVRDPIHICHRGNGIGIFLEKRTGIEIIHGDSVGIWVVRIQQVNALNGIGQVCDQLLPAEFILRYGAVTQRRVGDLLGPNIRGRKDRRHEAQHQHKYQQKRKQLLVVRFHT